MINSGETTKPHYISMSKFYLACGLHSTSRYLVFFIPDESLLCHRAKQLCSLGNNRNLVRCLLKYNSTLLVDYQKSSSAYYSKIVEVMPRPNDQ